MCERCKYNPFLSSKSSWLTRLKQPCWYNVGLPDLQHTEAIIVECNTNASCKDFVFDNIQVFPETMQAATVICMNATAALNPDLGFKCANSTFVPL